MHKYACQNAAQALLDHMYPVPEYFKPDPKYVCADENAFVDGFRCLWNTFRDMYQDIIENPEPWGLPCVEDYDPGTGKYKFDPKRAESKNAPRRVMDYLKILCQIGELQGDMLIVPFQAYTEQMKKGKRNVENTAIGITDKAARMLLNRLISFGFDFSGFDGKAFDKNMAGFAVSYTGNCNLIPALKGYCMTPCRRGKLAVCHYDAVAAPGAIPEPACAFTFGQYLTGRHKAFFDDFNAQMLAEGFVCTDSESYEFEIEYYRKEQQPLDKKKPCIVRCKSAGNRLDIMMKMMDIPNYCGYVESLPDRIKSCYKVSHCRNCFGDWRECVSVKRWKIDGESFADCQWGEGAHISEYDPDDVGTYISIIKMEAGHKRYK